MSNTMSASNLPQGSKLATYMNRGNGAPNFNNTGNMSQLATDLNNLGLDPGTLKKLSMSGIREFIPPNSGGAGPAPTQGLHQGSPVPADGNSGSSSPFQPRLQPPPSGTMGSGPPPFGNSPRASPTPSSSSMSSMMQQPRTATSEANDPSSFSIYSDGGTTYFYSSEAEMPMGAAGEAGMMNNSMAVPTHNPVILPNYSMYTGTPNHVANMKLRSNVPSFIAENELKMEVLKRQHICQAQIDPEACGQLPREVDNFAQLCPMEPPPASPMHKSQTFGYVTSVYKATNTKNGQFVALRRIHGFRLVNTKCMVLVDQWKKLQHANLIALRQVFTTKSFNDHSMVFVYDFYAGAETLFSRHFSGSNQMSGNGGQFMDPYSGGPDPNARSFNPGKMLRQQAVVSQSVLLPESLIWTYVIQMTSALRHIHLAGLACRTLDPTKILIINKTRLLLNCCGIFDVLTFDPTSSNPMAAMAHYQQEDLIALGKIVLALACNSFMAIQRENLQTSMEIVTSTYSSDMRNLIMYLLTNPTRIKSVNDLMPMIGARFYDAIDEANTRNDIIEADLAKDIESSRLFRLLTKLSTVVDRAELNGDESWSEYGDRYMLKLFRDYVFHQVMEDGRPWLDMAHVISCLNKFDAGVQDKISLMSRDEQNVLVVSYAELKECLVLSYSECMQSAKQASSRSGGHHSTSASQHQSSSAYHHH